MKKALILATAVGFIANFEMNDISILQEMGYEVHVVSDMSDCNNKEKLNKLLHSGIIAHNIKFFRNPFKYDNIKAYNKLNRLVKTERFDLIHCHTPVGGVFGRAVGHFNHVKQVIYTAHGFHFFKGAPLKNWLIYYPIEKIFSRWADIQITLNNEDYKRAQKFHTKIVKRIHGIGIDISKFNQDKSKREAKRTELNIDTQDVMLLSVGQLERDKHQIVVLKAMKKLAEYNCKYYICGVGNKEKEYQTYINENQLQNNVFLLGYRTDVAELLQAADVFVFPSLFEGLSVALMEAVAAKIPIACTNVRGNVDTVITRESYFSPNNDEELVSVIEKIIFTNNNSIMVEKNFTNLKKFQLSHVEQEMRAIYKIADDMIEKRKTI